MKAAGRSLRNAAASVARKACPARVPITAPAIPASAPPTIVPPAAPETAPETIRAPNPRGTVRLATDLRSTGLLPAESGSRAPIYSRGSLPRCDAQFTNVGAVRVRSSATPRMRSASRQAISALSCMCPSGSEESVANCRRRRPPPPPDSALVAHLQSPFSFRRHFNARATLIARKIS